MDRIFDVIGEGVEKNSETGFYTVTTKEGQILKVADLVDPENQSRAFESLRNVTSPDDVDMVIALGCLLYTSPSPRDQRGSRMPSSA